MLLVLGWLNHRFHRYYTIRDHEDRIDELIAAMENKKKAADLVGEDDEGRIPAHRVDKARSALNTPGRERQNVPVMLSVFLSNFALYRGHLISTANSKKQLGQDVVHSIQCPSSQIPVNLEHDEPLSTDVTITYKPKKISTDKPKKISS